MKTGLRFFDRNVIRKEENGMTIVLQKACICIDDVEGLSNAFNLIPAVRSLITAHNSYYEDENGVAYLVFEGKGISRCNPEDTYDEKIGFRIAETRAQKDVFNKAAKFFNGITYFIEKVFYDDLMDKLTTITDAVYECNDHELDIK